MRPANIAVKGLLGFGFWEIEGAERMTVRWSQATRQGTFFLPGLIGKVGDGFPGPWAHLWSDEGLEEYRYAHVHAFDAEVRVYAGLAYAIVGVSPGEFVDFLAGFVGLDPARDDGR